MVAAQARVSGAASARRFADFLDGRPGLSGADVDRLAADPAALAPDARRLVQVHAEALARAADDGTRAKLAARLVASLTADTFAAQSGAILTTLAAHPGPSEDPADALIERLPELGPAAAPVLARMIAAYRAAERDPTYSQLAALCRLAPSPDARLKADLLHFWSAANRPSPHTYRRRGLNDRIEVVTGMREARLTDREGLLYVTLLRLGLRAEADGLAAHHQATRYRERTLQITPRSPPAVCTFATVA